MRIADEVRGHELLVRVGEHVLERSAGRRLAERVVDLLDGHRLVHHDGQVRQRDIRRRNADRDAVDLPLQLGNDERRGLRRACRRRDDGHRGRACAAQVLVRQVQHVLIVRVAVNGHHRAAHEPEVVAHHLDHRNEAVGRARRVRYDVVLLGIVLGLVDAEDDGDVLRLRGGRDDHLFRAGVEVLLRFRRFREPSRRLEHDVDAEVLPRQLRRLLLREHLDLVAVDRDRPVAGCHVTAIRPVDRVVLEEVGQPFGIGEVVDRDKIDVRDALQLRGPHDLSPDPTETVDSHSNGHCFSLVTNRGNGKWEIGNG